MAERYYRTRSGRHMAILNSNSEYGPWPHRTDFAWLGIIILPDSSRIGWAWHLDGRSIDRSDDAFDLIDFPRDDLPDYARSA